MISLDVLIAGLATGSIYGLLALGYHITFVVSNTVNFSLGATLMFGAVMFYELHTRLGLDIFIAVPLVLLFSGLLGMIVERFFVRPFCQNNSVSWLLSTIALGIILENIVRFTFGQEPRSIPTPSISEPIRLFNAGIYPIEFIIPAVGISVALMLWLLSKKTIVGRALLAAAQNRDAATLQGINVKKLIILAYVVSTALAGLAGMLIAPKLNVSAGMGTLIGLKAFAAAIIGGILSAPGCLVAGVGYGVFESIVAAQLPSAFREILGFGLLIIILIFKPNGLFGKKGVYKV